MGERLTRAALLVTALSLAATTVGVGRSLAQELDSQPACIGYADSNGVYSEDDLSVSLLNAISERNRLFSDFYKNPTENPAEIYLHHPDDEDDRTSVFDLNSNSLRMSSLVFSQPRFPNEGWLRLDHELAKIVAIRKLVNNEDQSLYRELDATYVNLVVAAGYYELPIVPDNPDPAFLQELDQNPIFRNFNELTYIPGARRDGLTDSFGSPHLSPTDLFASYITVFINFNALETAAFQGLTQRQKDALRNTHQGIGHILGAIEPHPGLLQSMIRS